jgi:hypothetical protein
VRANEPHAVLIRLDASYSPDDLEDLEDALSLLVKERGVGEFDGNEIGPTETTLFLYGPDADALFSVIQETLRQSTLSRGARVILRYGEPGSTQKELLLAEEGGLRCGNKQTN